MKKTILIACGVLAGCSAQPVPYHSGNEIPPGAGLLSGPDGAVGSPGTELEFAL